MRYSLSIDQMLGQYRVAKPLGKGGMGEVYLVEHQILRTRHALKLLPPERAQSAGFLDRFRDEARVMANLQHPGVAHVTHADVSDGHHYLVMDFVSSGEDSEPFDLEEALAAAPEGRLPPNIVARLAIGICEAVGYAHDKGIIHRDLKPSNVLLTSRDLSIAEPRVVDFGLARLVGEDWLRSVIDASIRQSVSLGGMPTMAQPRAERSTTGAILGTYEYMSPEQREGGEVDHRSDIYALGVMMYRMLTGKRLMGRAKAASHIVKALSSEWDLLTDSCLDEAPPERPASMSEVVAALRSLLSTVHRQREAVDRVFADGTTSPHTRAKNTETGEQTDIPSTKKASTGLVFTCERCGEELRAETEWVGREAECPYCACVITVPQPQFRGLGRGLGALIRSGVSDDRP